MPSNSTWKQFYGVSILAGIGFTMSLFIANLAFGEGAVLDNAKIGILVASLVAGIAGWMILSSAATNTDASEEVADKPAVEEDISTRETLVLDHSIHSKIKSSELTEEADGRHEEETQPEPEYQKL